VGEDLDAADVVEILRGDLERERWQNVLLRAKIKQLQDALTQPAPEPGPGAPPAP